MNRPAGLSRLRFALASAAIIATGLLGAGVNAPVAHAAASTYYFHGLPGNGDDATRQAGTPSATFTFDTTAPTGTAPSTMTSAPVLLVPAPCGDSNYSYWVGAFTGTINGSIHLDWWWQTTNASAIAAGSPVDITVCGDGIQIGHLDQANVLFGATPTESSVDVPVNGTVISTLLIQAAPHFIVNGANNTVLYNSASEPSSFAINSGPPPTPTPTPTATPTPTPGGGNTGNQLFSSYPAPTPYPHVFQPPTGVFLLFGEPSIGVDWQSNTTMYQGDLNTWQINFGYSPGVVPTATWADRSDEAAAQASLDARLITDHAGRSTDRTIIEQLNGGNSFEAYTDSNGGTAAPPANSTNWVTSTGGTFPSGEDHESIASGPYSAYVAPPTGAGTVYPKAVYYCSQDLAGLGSFCVRSDTGSATWGQPVQVYSTECIGLHGKPRVGPDGVVYLPNKDCSGLGGANAAKGLAISRDNGATWTVHNIPNTTVDANQLDPDVAVGGGPSGTGTVYYTYRDGDHHAKVVVSNDDGDHWTAPIDLGSVFGIQNATMTQVIAGDKDRAAVTFIGTTCPGDDSVESLSCNGAPARWDLYVAFTYDGGATWQEVDAAPNDPVQRGGVCAGGTGCPSNGDGSTSRNMLDFNDTTIDKQGRVQVAWTDGCTASCVTTPSGGTACSVPNVHNDGSVCLGRNSSLFSVSDQTCGLGLFAAFDNQPFNNDPSCTSVVTPESPVATLLVYSGVVAAGIAAFVFRRRRPRKGTPAPA